MIVAPAYYAAQCGSLAIHLTCAWRQETEIKGLGYLLGRLDDSCLLQSLVGRSQQAKCQVVRGSRTVMAREMAKALKGRQGGEVTDAYIRGAHLPILCMRSSYR